MKELKLVVTIVAFMFFGIGAYAQQTLDVEAKKDCELFSKKKDYDKQERYDKIKELGGQTVTVYIVKGKTNKIIDTYTGTVDLTLINKGGTPETSTSVLVVTVDMGNGQVMAKFPLTDNKEFRIYLTECLNN